MSRLKIILGNTEVVSVYGDADVEISSLTFDSRTAGPGSLFFAVRGTQADGHDYILKAEENGASAVVCEKMPQTPGEGVTYILVGNSEIAMGEMAAAFYGNPSGRLKLVGVTGTNGKTTTATLLYDLFRALGYKAGLISTVIYRINDREVEATHTTPDAICLNTMISEMVDEGCDYCFMEVSSHSIAQHRISSLRFAGGIFTNITHDHLDYHGTFAEYIKAKKAFFDWLPKGAFALVNVDDRNGRIMVQNTKAEVRTYSTRGMADFTCRIREMHFDGMLLELDSSEIWVGLTGRFNADNILCVYGAARMLGAEKDETLKEISRLHSVNGRFDSFRSDNGVIAIVDYAHTPDALQNVIDTINGIRSGGQKLFTVVGCGGNRDTAKRPVMGRIAASGSDIAILTSDNPRLEDPDEIIAQMKAGIGSSVRYMAITDRREAIRAAVMMAGKGDIILIAGKGHETYQDVGGVKSHFDDREELAKLFFLSRTHLNNNTTDE